ncbi:hypothetical protein E4P41_16460 [Geodermatophilus sp. DF01-2]|uniref:Orn/Lys/Arg family decarboxylase n=1 Tax=Geodermatophilus sp. DF01-2 TaxID=2559610 RepID=UPI001073E37A|nr:hypothetical protein [Geodermatophilus sp. DF01_2]TFV55905.1 hypothetical protein E4P41_16460 [Geodermatophilus sp. DF01_2]
MDRSCASVLEALQEFPRRGDLLHGRPGYEQGRRADPRPPELVGTGVLASDVLSPDGPHDRRGSQKVVPRAEQLMADAVGVDHLAERAMPPRDAFSAPGEPVPAAQAVGRMAAEPVNPHPPGVPVLAPGERISPQAVDHPVTGVRAGMLVPDAADPSMETLRVVV